MARKDTGQVIAGNGTLQAALLLGREQIAVVFVAMDTATAAGYSIADNRTAELADWDAGILATLLEDLDTGNDAVLDALIATLAMEVGIVPGEEKTPPPRQAKEEVAATCPSCGHEFKPGDVAAADPAAA